MVKTRHFISLSAGFLAIVLFSFAMAEEPGIVQLPAPQTEGGKPLMTALKERQSMRSFSEQKLSEQTLSDLLWAAFGINRPETGGRTAPSAMNMQETDIYLALEEGLYLYDAKSNTLKPVLEKDLRAATGKQKFAGEAPLNLIFVADYARIGDKLSKEAADKYATVDVGYISQNVYLFCASEGLGTVVRNYFDEEKLSSLMQLDHRQRIILVQTVGYPK